MAAKRMLRLGPIGIVVLCLIILGAIVGDKHERGHSDQSAVRTLTDDLQSTGDMIAPRTGFVTADTLNVRAAPKRDAQVLLTIGRGETVTATRQAGVWYGIELSDGTIGWLHGDYLADRAPAAPTRLATSRVNDNSSCHPSYAGLCLPIVRDLDCPEISGAVRVVGRDVYRLDRDGDGIGCE